jgi:hypothetical protein
MRHTTRNRNNRIRAQKNRKRIALLAKRAKKAERVTRKNPAEAGS